MATEVKCPMPGKLISILVKVGDQVKENDPVFVIESMKMQVDVVAPVGGVIKEIKVQEGTAVAAGEVMAIIE